MRILIAEDEPSVRAFMLRAFENLTHGAQIDTVADGDAALALARGGGYDLLISDHHMPTMSGLELLRSLHGTVSTCCVLVSADSSLEPHALAAGAALFLLKPMSLSDLRRAASLVAS